MVTKERQANLDATSEYDYCSWSNYALSSTVNGMALAFQVTKKTRSILNMEFWVFVIMLLVPVGLTMKAFVLYWSFPIATRVSLTNRENQMFPAITVCSANPLKKSGVAQFPRLVESLSILYTGSHSRDQFNKRVVIIQRFMYNKLHRVEFSEFGVMQRKSNSIA